MERGQLAGEPKVLRTNGMIEYRDGYDVRNSIMLSAGIHGSFKNVHWSIYEHNGQHFIQAVLRNFWAAGAPDEAEPRDEEDMGVEAGVDDDDEYSQLSLDDEALHRAWRSGDIVVDENFFIS
ncbi:hypothetical protein HK104_008692 [Borealophlyctis nickersoniae]|nr:hypothetical protein HK104_008692 [Borealophlyctis nickersoniae]